MPTKPKAIPKRQPIRKAKTWSTRDEIAAGLDTLADRMAAEWNYTVDRSKILTAFTLMLMEAERYIEKNTVTVISEETLKEALYTVLRKHRG